MAEKLAEQRLKAIADRDAERDRAAERKGEAPGSRIEGSKALRDAVSSTDKSMRTLRRRSLEGKSVKDLKAQAKGKIKGYGKMRKSDLIKALLDNEDSQNNKKAQAQAKKNRNPLDSMTLGELFKEADRIVPSKRKGELDGLGRATSDLQKAIKKSDESSRKLRRSSLKWLNVKELKARAKGKVKGYSKMKKKELVEAIIDAEMKETKDKVGKKRTGPSEAVRQYKKANPPEPAEEDIKGILKDIEDIISSSGARAGLKFQDAKPQSKIVKFERKKDTQVRQELEKQLKSEISKISKLSSQLQSEIAKRVENNDLASQFEGELSNRETMNELLAESLKKRIKKIQDEKGRNDSAGVLSASTKALSRVIRARIRLSGLRVDCSALELLEEL